MWDRHLSLLLSQSMEMVGRVGRHEFDERV